MPARCCVKLERQWRYFGWLGLAAICLLLDRLSKSIAIAALAPNEAMAVVPGFNFTLTFNTGASFSMLSDAGGWQRWLLSALAIGFSCFAVYWIRASAGKQLLVPAGLSLILGGALGNLWDRLTLGHVIDFIQVYYKTWYFPVFNLADTVITLGATLLLLDALQDFQAQRRGSAPSGS
ncbi:MAG: lipoprotein signal peptidase [Gammaproteobacteria bacterium]|nr:lipoprotein signal peptidase [Gammaproteobacteria bacterium]